MNLSSIGTLFADGRQISSLYLQGVKIYELSSISVSDQNIDTDHVQPGQVDILTDLY